ncbi:MAG: FHA domain-containing protein [Myxococcales bacterium]
MFTVVITEKTGAQKRLSFGEPEVTIGRVPGNDVVLPKGNVSKRHSRIVLKDNRFIVVDLKSTNGTYVNGRKITSPLVVKEGDKIYIGDFVLTLEGDMSASGSMRPPVSRQDLPLGGPAPISGHSPVPPLPSRAPEPIVEARPGMDDIPLVLRGNSPSMSAPLGPHTSAPPPPSVMPPSRTAPSMPPVIGGLDTVSERPPAEGIEGPSTPQEGVLADGSPVSRVLAPTSLGGPAPRRQTPPPARVALPPGAPSPGGQSDLRLLMLRIGREFDLDDADPSSFVDERRWQKAERLIHNKLAELANEQPTRFRDRLGLGKAALHEAVGLGPIDSLLADAHVFHIVVERFDRIRADRGQGLSPESVVFSAPQAVLTCLRRLCAQGGLVGSLPDSVELSLPNGLHVVAVLKAATSEGPVLSVQRRPAQLKSLSELAQSGLLTNDHASAIQEAVRNKRQVWFVGPGSGELARLVSGALHACDAEERVALFERSPEIAVGERSSVCLRLGTVDIETLLDRVRHFRPERLLIHTPRESELPTLLSKLSLHHEGSLVSFEQRSAKDALIALERAGGADAVLKAVSLMVELKRTPSGLAVGGVFEPAIDGSGLLTLIG